MRFYCPSCLKLHSRLPNFEEASGQRYVFLTNLKRTDWHGSQRARRWAFPRRHNITLWEKLSNARVRFRNHKVLAQRITEPGSADAHLGSCRFCSLPNQAYRSDAWLWRYFSVAGSASWPAESGNSRYLMWANFLPTERFRVERPSGSQQFQGRRAGTRGKKSSQGLAIE